MSWEGVIRGVMSGERLHCATNASFSRSQSLFSTSNTYQFTNTVHKTNTVNLTAWVSFVVTRVMLTDVVVISIALTVNGFHCESTA